MTSPLLTNAGSPGAGPPGAGPPAASAAGAGSPGAGLPPASLAHLWATVLDEIRRDPAISPANFSTWLRETQLIEPAPAPGPAPEPDEFVVGAPHAFARDRLARTFRPAIERALARCLQRQAVRVRFAVSGGPRLRTGQPGAGPPAAALTGIAAPGAGATERLSTAPLPVAGSLNPRLTFDRFVAGRGSEFAVAAARAVADNPALAYNPLYLYGDPGTGKTHLLQAIGNHIVQRRPQAGVFYARLTAVTPLTGVPGRAVVLLDDVQEAPPDAGEALLQCLAGLHEASAQVVVAGDRPPRELTALDGRLRAWLQMGLVAGIGTPDFETRVTLVRQRADVLGARLPPAVLELIARRAPSDARELEGMVTRVVAGAELSGLPLTPEHVGAFLADLADVLGPVSTPVRRRVTAEAVLQATAATFGVPVAELQGRRRDKEIVLPRQVAMYLMRHETGASLAEIGAELGGRDHSTVIHGCERIASALAADSRLRELVAAARQLVVSAAAPGRAPAAARLD